jgi:amidohydrolase
MARSGGDTLAAAPSLDDGRPIRVRRFREGAPTMLEDIPALLPDLKALYEDLHANPELSFCEHRTAKILGERLEVLGYEVTSEVGATGVVAIMENGDGPYVLLRADIDALPVREDTGLPYASTVTGVAHDGREHPVAHACGHDMHATWMIGVATLLATHRDEWQGKVMLLLQPAEELGEGARAMIGDGLFERFGTPDIGLGQHVAPAPAGWILHRAGPVMSASDALRVVLHGRGAHGSAPQSSVDPVVMAASTVMRLQTIVSREVAATETAVVTVGTLHAGTKENIISDHASMTLSIRTFDPRVREHVLGAVTRIVEGEAAAAGAPRPPEITSFGSFPMLSNDIDATDRVVIALTEALGSNRVIEGPLVPASEDFGIFGEQGGFPSVFWFVGGADPDTFFAALAAGRVNEDIASNHSPYYAPVQDPTIAAGIEAMITAARCWLAPA